jgi:alkanesulfonate monooxygenase SsuD/methylene tetrahydromethanopterin reductase-like flavin-dependent oxidoreductase (luciferase family)
MLDIGILFMFRNPAFNRRPWPEVYQAELELAVEAERLGYDHVWLSEHHFVDDGYSPSLFPIAAAIAARTQRIRIGTYVLLLPLHNPVRVAEDAATVDVISNGRFDLGLGLGYRPGEFTGMGIPSSERGARFDEGLPLVQRLLAGETLSVDGRFNQVADVRIVPPAVQTPFPIWVGARGDKAIDRAARLGCHLASVGATEHRLKYLDALKRHGRKVADYSIAHLFTGYVAETTARAWDDCAEPLHHVIREYQAWAAESGDQTGDGAAELPVPSPAELRQVQSCEFFGRSAIIGDPDAVFDQLCAYHRESPGSHLTIMMSLPGADPTRTRNSMDLFAREVMPRLKAWASRN